MIEVEHAIEAPIERVFDLSRSVELHTLSTSQTKERAVGGVTSGLLGLGDRVTFRAKHLGVWQRLTSEIQAFERPTHFRDCMVEGIFARLAHDHFFQRSGAGTLMRDRLDYASPLGPLGRLVDALFLRAYLRSFLEQRARVIKAVAESSEWRSYVMAS